MKKILSVVAIASVICLCCIDDVDARSTGGGRSFSSPARMSTPTRAVSAPSRAFSSTPKVTTPSKPIAKPAASSSTVKPTKSHGSSSWMLIPFIMGEDDDDEQPDVQQEKLPQEEQEDCDLEDIISLDWEDCK